MSVNGAGSSLPPPLTDEERAELNEWADYTQHPREGWQVFDETDSTEDNYADVKAGPLHATCAEAEAFGESSGLEAWTVYRMRRCVTRDRKVWYMTGRSPVVIWC